MEQQTVIGIFDSATEAQNAEQRLLALGYTQDHIDVSRRDTINSEARTSVYSNDSTDRRDNNDGFGDKIGRFFNSLFDNDEEATKYSTAARNGCVVTVQAASTEEAHRAAEILDECGAVDVDERAQEYGYRSAAGIDSRSNLGPDAGRNTSIPVIEEQLEVGKREMETGGVRVRSRIVERPVEESIRLREEHVRVDRNTVDRPATDADFSTFKEGEIEVTETSEVPIVNKTARVVEEINLRKDVEEREETVRDTVRKTDVEVENLERDTTTKRRGKSK